jgi:hypothetical protein
MCFTNTRPSAFIFSDGNKIWFAAYVSNIASAWLTLHVANKDRLLCFILLSEAQATLCKFAGYGYTGTYRECVYYA